MNGEVGTNDTTDRLEKKQKQSPDIVDIAKLQLLAKTDEDTEEETPEHENNKTKRYYKDIKLELTSNFKVNERKSDTNDQLTSDKIKKKDIDFSSDNNSEDSYDHSAFINESKKGLKIEKNDSLSGTLVDHESSRIQDCKKLNINHNDLCVGSEPEDAYERYQSKSFSQCEEDSIKSGLEPSDLDGPKTPDDSESQNTYCLNDTIISSKKSDCTDSEDFNNHESMSMGDSHTKKSDDIETKSHIKKSDDTESNYSPDNGKSKRPKPSSETNNVEFKKSKNNDTKHAYSNVKANSDESDDDNCSVGTLSPNLSDDPDIDLLKSNELLTDDEMSLSANQDIDMQSVDCGKYEIVDVDKIKNGNKSPEIEILEIRSTDSSEDDDCVVTSVEKIKTPVKKKSKKISIPTSELRRSSRAVKATKYTEETEDIDDDDDESDLETVQNSPKCNSGVPKDKKVRKKSKAVHKSVKDPIEITIYVPKSKNKSISKKAQSNVTPTSSKTKSKNTLVQHPSVPKSSVPEPSVPEPSVPEPPVPEPPVPQPPEPILPTLTDDMFVVEAPSFIVPYVYEKPAQIPLKEFVDKLGKELKEEMAKQELELKEKQKAEKAQREKERQERREKGEIVPDSDEEEKSKKVEKAEKKVSRRRKKDEEDDVSWDGLSSEESDDESSEEDSQKDTIDDLPEISKIVPFPIPKLDSFFDLTLGKFFTEIGSNLVQEYVQTDLLNEQKKKLKRENRFGHNTASRQFSVAQLMKNLENTVKINESFKMKLKQCKFCNYKTESELVLQNHLETLHMRNNKYCCTYCVMELQNQFNMILHMQVDHGVRARYDPPLCANQCTLCLYEVQGKSKLGRHIINCAKKFNPNTNLAPPVDWEHPAKIPKLTQTRTPVSYTAQLSRLSDLSANTVNLRMPIGNALTSPTFRPRIMTTPSRPPNILAKQAALQQPVKNAGDIAKNSPSIIIGPAPRLDGPLNSQTSNAKDIVMCEICDGYIQDLEQLRNHMQWVHKIKMHPKMIHNRPPLNCQKCQHRFFTDQGLERHLLGAHGLVTSAIQEDANKGKDAGRCPVCGRAYQRKLLAHVARDHNLTLKPANLSYKCTVCMATFGLYRQFENHVYSAHSAVVKKDTKKPATGDTVKGKTTNVASNNNKS